MWIKCKFILYQKCKYWLRIIVVVKWLSKLTKFNITVCGVIHGERRNVSSMLGNRKQDKAVVSFKLSCWGNVKAAISQSIKALKKKEWVKSISDTTDKRKSYIVLTDEGRKAYDNQRKVIIRNLQECFRDVDEADLKMFCDKLTKVAEQISLKI